MTTQTEAAFSSLRLPPCGASGTAKASSLFRQPFLHSSRVEMIAFFYKRGIISY